MARTTKGDGWELIPARRAEAPVRPPSAAAGEQSVRVTEEKRAQGKLVTVARGFRHDPGTLAALAKELKKACGAGGTVQGDAIEVQGRHLEEVAARLEAKGYRVRRG